MMGKTLRWKMAQWAELKWWKRYLNKKDKTEYLQWKRAYWNGVLKKLGNSIAIKSHDRILDAGCGPAGIFTIFPKHQVTAIDPLLQEYEENLTHFQPKEYPNVNFVNTSIEAFQPKESFYVVFCLNAINHVEDIDLAWEVLLEKCLEKGSRVVVSIDAHNHSFFKKLFRLLPGDILHPHQYDLKEYEEMLQQRNCELEKSLLLKEEFFFNHYIIIARKI